MEPVLRQLLDEMQWWGRDNDEREQEHQRKMLNLEPDTAQFVSILIRISRKKALLEIGTSNGYSTIWLAWAAKFTEGHVSSIERNQEKYALADTNLQRAGLREHVTLLLGDATELVSTLPGPFDFVLFDADRISAPKQLKLLEPKLLLEALVLADNALSHPDEIAPYLAAVQALSGYEHITLPIGKGVSLAYKYE